MRARSLCLSMTHLQAVCPHSVLCGGGRQCRWPSHHITHPLLSVLTQHSLSHLYISYHGSLPTAWCGFFLVDSSTLSTVQKAAEKYNLIVQLYFGMDTFENILPCNRAKKRKVRMCLSVEALLCCGVTRHFLSRLKVPPYTLLLRDRKAVKNDLLVSPYVKTEAEHGKERNLSSESGACTNNPKAMDQWMEWHQRWAVKS